MSFSYDPEKLSSNQIYQIRLSIGNTDQYDLAGLEDEEIQFLLDRNNENIDQTIVASIDSRIAKAGGLVDKTTGQTQESASQLIDVLQKLRDDMLNSVSRHTPIYSNITGVLESERQEVINDPCIFHDGVNMQTEPPDCPILNGPLTEGPGSV